MSQPQRTDIKSKIKILITGGHATPAIACITELLNRGYEKIEYVGQKKSIIFDRNYSSEYRLISQQLNIKFYTLITGKLSLFPNLASIIWLIRLPFGFLHGLFIILLSRPNIILSFGGHIAVPIAFWGFIFKIPIITHEQTTTIGRANYLIQKLATKICISWDTKLVTYNRNLDKTKIVVTGNPIREDIFNVKTNMFKFFESSRPTILIMGGNQGSHYINDFIFQNIYYITAKYNLIHQTGSNTVYNDYKKALDLAQRINQDGTKYIPVDYLFVNYVAEAYFKSDLVICRSGANTVVELIFLRKKAILIPIMTSSGNEQFKNAKIFEKTGLGKTLLQSELNITSLLNYIEYLLNNESYVNTKYLNKLVKMHKNAAKKIIDIMESLII